MNDINFDMIYNTVMYYAPGFGWMVITGILLLIAMALGKEQSDRMWKNNIKFHLSKVTKEEIETRDAEIKRLTEELEEVKLENSTLSAACAAMKNIADVMKPVESKPSKGLIERATKK